MTSGTRDEARIAIHAVLTVVMAGIAFWFALPWETFTTSQSYAVLASMGGEMQWAAVLFIVAAIGAAGFYITTPWMRFASVMVVATAHGVMALAFVIANPAGTLIWPYSGLAALGYWMCWSRARMGLDPR